MGTVQCVRVVAPLLSTLAIVHFAIRVRATRAFIPSSVLRPPLLSAVTMVRSSSLAVAAAVVLVQHVSAHTNMAFPQPEFPAGFYNGNSPYARMDSTKLPGTDGIAGYQGVKKIAAALEASSGDKTLRSLIYKYATGVQGTLECGKTLLTGAKKPVPDEIDFPWGHPGPCEAWCDDTKIYSNADCQGNNVGKIKVDKSKCTNAKRLQVMYAGVHVENYELYSNCVPLTGSGSGGSSTPAVTSKAPAAAAKPAKTPAAAGTKPASPKPAAAAPSPTKKKCKRRMR